MSALDPAMGVIVSSEFCRVSMGIPAAIGVSVGLAGGTINARGSIEQRKRWARDLMTFDKVGAWAITEPDAGSDAFGGMRTTVRRDGDEWVLNGQKTFITNGPYADTIVVYAKHDDGSGLDRRDQPVLTFVLDSGHGRTRRRASRCARWACTPRRPASCSSTRSASATTGCSGRRPTAAARRAPGPTSSSSGSASPASRSASSRSACGCASTTRSRASCGASRSASSS